MDVLKLVGHPAAMVELAGEMLGPLGPFCQMFMKSVKFVPEKVIVFLPCEE